jgi:hypothetical protein
MRADRPWQNPKTKLSESSPGVNRALTALTVNAVASNPALKIHGVTVKRLWHV